MARGRRPRAAVRLRLYCACYVTWVAMAPLSGAISLTHVRAGLLMLLLPRLLSPPFGRPLHSLLPPELTLTSEFVFLLQQRLLLYL